MPTPEGKVKRVRGRCHVYIGENGTPNRAAGTLQDITSQWESEELLRLQSAALNSSANGVIITDRDGTIQWVNPAFTGVTGYALDESIGRKPGTLLKSGTHDQAFYRDMWETISRGDIWKGELTNRRKDGSIHLEEQTITPVRRADGTITHFVGVKRDLTEQKRLEQQFLHAQKMEVIGRLAGGVAHDFNNLLVPILAVAEAAIAQLPPAHPLAEDLRDVLTAAQRGREITAQLLAFADQDAAAAMLGHAQRGAAHAVMGLGDQRLVALDAAAHGPTRHDLRSLDCRAPLPGPFLLLLTCAVPGLPPSPEGQESLEPRRERAGQSRL